MKNMECVDFLAFLAIERREKKKKKKKKTHYPYYDNNNKLMIQSKVANMSESQK